MRTLQMIMLPCMLCSIFMVTACQRANPWVKEGDALVQEATILEAQHQLLNARLDSLWDATSATLDNELPTDFPSVDRDIFIHARNADHIRMFMSFKTISPELKSLVDKAGMYDQMLAQQMRELQSRQQSFEKQKYSFLEMVGQHDKASREEYTGQFRLASSTLQ